jgi:hypothetical protein
MGLLSAFLGLFAIHLKHSSFWPSAGVKPKQKDLVHVMHCMLIFALSLSLCAYYALNVLPYLCAMQCIHNNLHRFMVFEASAPIVYTERSIN